MLAPGSDLVRVLPTLQLPAYPEIFAAGDIIDWDEQKQSGKVSMGHAPVVVKNILSFVEGKPVKAEYKGSLEIIAITNGKVSRILLPFLHPYAATNYCQKLGMLTKIQSPVMN